MRHAQPFQALLWELSANELRAHLKDGASVNEPDELGDYLLTVACDRLQLESVQLLLSHAADPNVQNTDGDTPLLCAINCVAHNPSNALRIASALIDAGANLETRGFMDKTPFLKACSRGNTDMVRLLVERGADHRAIVQDDGPLDGLELASIFHAPAELTDYLHSLRK